MNSERKYDKQKELAYCEHGEIIEDGENYDVVYGANNIYITEDDIRRIKDGAMFYYTDGEYAYCLVYKEDVEPAEPLIKDEKIRKAVRTWAECCDILVVKHYLSEGNSCFVYVDGEGNDICLDLVSRVKNLVSDKIYTLAELCGEEEE